MADSDAPMRVVAAFTGAQMKRLRGDDGLFWTPGTDGEAQLIELYRPAGVPAAGVRVQAPALSHLFASSRNGFKLLEKIGESGSCNVDSACRVAELGQAFVDAKNARGAHAVRGRRQHLHLHWHPAHRHLACDPDPVLLQRQPLLRRRRRRTGAGPDASGRQRAQHVLALRGHRVRQRSVTAAAAARWRRGLSVLGRTHRRDAAAPQRRRARRRLLRRVERRAVAGIERRARHPPSARRREEGVQRPAREQQRRPAHRGLAAGHHRRRQQRLGPVHAGLGRLRAARRAVRRLGLVRQHGVAVEHVQPRRVLALRRRVPAHQRASGRRADADERLAAADPAGRADRPRRRCAHGEALRQR